MPLFEPSEKRYQHDYTVQTGDMKIVADYCNMSITAVYELDYVHFLELYRDAVIYNNMQSPEGNERLENAWILEQTKPDRARLKSAFGDE